MRDDNESLLELLYIYVDMVEKQDEIINQLGKIVVKQASDLKLFNNYKNEDIDNADEIIIKYEEIKRKLEP